MNEGSAVNCTFKNNYANRGGAMDGGYAVLCRYENNENSYTERLNIFHVHDIYGLGEKLLLDLRYEDCSFNGLKVTILVYKGNDLFGTYHALTGEEWSVDLPMGFYTATLTVDRQDIDPANIKIFIGQALSFWNLNQTINANSNPTIDLYDDYIFNESTDSSFRDGIEISRDVTIDGHGLVIDAREFARIFNVINGNVTFKNINFINGNTDGNGGAITGSNYKAISCTFDNNRAGESGGAMNDGSAVNCTFKNNHADQSGGALSGGEAYYCTFTGNEARNNGGALNDVKAYDCNFTNNHAGESGGAMNDGSAVNCTFKNNHADGEGDAMDGGYAVLCIYENNENFNTGRLNIFHVHDIQGLGEKLLLDLSYGDYVFNGFKVTILVYKGVALFGTYNYLTGEEWSVDLPNGFYTATLTVDHQDIDPANIKIFIGQALSFWNLNQTINANGNPTIDLYDDYVFNETTDSGFRDGIEISRDVTIDGHGLVIDAREFARIFNVINGNVTFKNINFINGNTDGNGGAITGSNYKAISCTFTDNHAYGDGGAMYGGSAVNCIFTGNHAEWYGGAMSGGSAVNCIFEDNHDEAWYAIFGISVDSCIFINNNYDGEVVYSPTLTVGNLKSSYKSGEKLTFNLKTHGGMPINDGIIKISISTPDHVEIGTYTCLSGEGWTVDLPVGNYFADFSTDYAGFEKFRKTITVSVANTVIYADAISSVYNVDKNLVITLKDAKGNPLSGFKLTVNLNGVKSLTTDKNGQVKVSTKGLVPKAYTAKISFDGNANYARSYKEVKVTVKKATPKMTAKNNKFKAKKAKKYTVTLKSNVGKAMKKVKLTIKVGKKTFKARTNAKGKATFKIKKLTKKGKYKATVKFAGNNCYNKVTKKVKITIK